MRRFVHDFLKWFPTALVGGALAVAALWTKAKDWIAEISAWGWAHMSDPFIALILVVALAAYIAAIIWTGQEQSADRSQREGGFALEASRAMEIDQARQAALDREARLQSQKRRRDLIADCRDLAFRFTRETPEESFRKFLEGERAYADIRSHLSDEYVGKLNAGRTTYSNADGARYPTLVGWFLDDLDRLEKECEL